MLLWLRGLTRHTFFILSQFARHGRDRVQQRVDGRVDRQDENSGPSVGFVSNLMASQWEQPHNADWKPAHEVGDHNQEQVLSNGHVLGAPVAGVVQFALVNSHGEHRSVDGYLPKGDKDEQDEIDEYEDSRWKLPARMTSVC